MSQDYSALDRPDILSFMFYPRKDVSIPPPGSTDHLIPVDKDVSLACRFYTHNLNSPSILYFHGNGEVISDYDYIAPLYNQLDINLCVAEFRGYGASQGKPTFSTTLSDAPIIFESFTKILRQEHYSGPIFIMGRSLGGIPALEIVHHYHNQIRGLILESSFSSIIRLLLHHGFPIGFVNFKDAEFPNLSKIRSVAIPTLIIHGEYDSLIPPSEAQALFENSAAENKHLVIIPGADHNSIMQVGLERYLEAIKEFVCP